MLCLGPRAQPQNFSPNPCLYCILFVFSTHSIVYLNLRFVNCINNTLVYLVLSIWTLFLFHCYERVKLKALLPAILRAQWRKQGSTYGGRGWGPKGRRGGVLGEETIPSAPAMKSGERCKLLSGVREIILTPCQIGRGGGYLTLRQYDPVYIILYRRPKLLVN